MSRATSITIAVLLALTIPSVTALALPRVTPPDSAFEPIEATFPTSLDQTVAIPAHLPAPGTANGIGPGSHLLITFADQPGSLFACTANYVWKGTNGKTYLGAAGHCFLPEDKAATHGPGADYDASGVTVRACISGCSFGGELGFLIQGTTRQLGPVAYARQTGPSGDLGNDFGLVEIPAALVPGLRYTEPVWGGPTGGVREMQTGSLVCLYGNAAGFGETFATMARLGVAVSTFPSEGRWHAAIPSFQGDSGAAVLTCEQDGNGVHGRYASGLLTHLATGSIAGTTMAKAKSMATQASLNVDARFAP